MSELQVFRSEFSLRGASILYAADFWVPPLSQKAWEVVKWRAVCLFAWLPQRPSSMAMMLRLESFAEFYRVKVARLFTWVTIVVLMKLPERLFRKMLMLLRSLRIREEQLRCLLIQGKFSTVLVSVMSSFSEEEEGQSFLTRLSILMKVRLLGYTHQMTVVNSA